MYLEKYDLKGRVAVVTGGGRGIGLACCRALGEAGAKIDIADNDLQEGQRGQKALAKAKIKVAEVAQLEVTDADQVKALAKHLNKKHGHVDILVANAGIARSGTAAE